MKIYGLLLAVVAASLLSCHEKNYLVGYFDYATFQEQCDWDTYVDEDYRAREKWLDSLATLDIRDSLELNLFLGCYCGDSRKWVSRYYALEAVLPVKNVEIISVDTTKKDEKRMADMVGLEKIPTFIFYQDGNEIGRIVEKPKGRLEKHLYLLLKNCE